MSDPNNEPLSRTALRLKWQECYELLERELVVIRTEINNRLMHNGYSVEDVEVLIRKMKRFVKARDELHSFISDLNK